MMGMKLLCCVFTILLISGLGNSQAQVPPEARTQRLQSLYTFPIAVGAQAQTSLSAAFDGTNYLVGIQGDGTNPYWVTAQLVSRSGDPIGDRISLGRNGGLPAVAFDGTNYLLVWEDFENPGDRSNLYGQFITALGTPVGVSFPICEAAGNQGSDSRWVVFDGTNYLVVWSDTRSSGWHIYARFVSKTGELLFSEILVTEAQGIGAGVACGGSNCLVAWKKYQAVAPYDNSTYGQRIDHQSGTKVDSNFPIFNDLTTTTTPGNYPIPVLYNNSEYVVSLSDKTLEDSVRHFVRTVTEAGGVSTDEITLYDGQTLLGCWVSAFDGQSYQATLSQGWGPPFTSPVRSKVRFFDLSFNPLGTDWLTIAETQNNKIPVGPFFLYDGFRYFGVLDWKNADFSGGEVYGVFLTGPNVRSLYLPIILKN